MSSSGERPRGATRRRLLAAVGAVGATLIAGCGGFGPGGGDATGTTETGTTATETQASADATETETPTTATETETPTTATETETETQTSATETDTPESAANETSPGGQGGTRRLTVGETFAAPTGVRATVERVVVRESGEGAGNGSDNRTGPDGRPVTVPEGQEAVAVRFRATNGSDATANAPAPSSITVRAGGRAFEPIGVGRVPQGYTGGSLDPGASASGWLLYLLPAGIPRSKLTVAWSGRGSGRTWTAAWTTGR